MHLQRDAHQHNALVFLYYLPHLERVPMSWFWDKFIENYLQACTIEKHTILLVYFGLY